LANYSKAVARKVLRASFVVQSFADVVVDNIAAEDPEDSKPVDV